MLIWQLGDWRIESDGYISGHDLAMLDELRLLRRATEQLAARDASQAAARVRALQRRARQRGYDAGRLLALRDFVVPHAAAAFALSRMNEQLVQIAMKAITDVIGDLPSGATLPNQLRRCLAAAQAQRLLSVRVAAEDFDEAKRALEDVERELGLPLVNVLMDATLPPRSCVVETDSGVVDGSLRLQLAALERGMRDAIAAVLDEYRWIDDGLAKQLRIVEKGLYDTLDVLIRRNEHEPSKQDISFP